MAFAKEEKIAYQVDVEAGDTGTEASALAVSREGIPTALLSVPVRYMHSSVETLSVDDVISAAKLAARYIAYGNKEAKRERFS